MNHTQIRSFVSITSTRLTIIDHRYLDRTDTQPTSARWEVVDGTPKKRVLGGTKAGNGAWGLAWVDTVMEFRDQDYYLKESSEAKERERLMKEAQQDITAYEATQGPQEIMDLT